MVAVTSLQRAAADSLVGVYAMVGIAPPKTPALITQPTDNTVRTSSGTIVAGSCPVTTPQAVIVVRVDDAVVGSAACDSNNDFSMPLILRVGAHVVTAQAYSLTEAAGPTSEPVHISYQPSASAKLPATSDVALSPDRLFASLGADRTATWSGTLTGSNASYKLLVNWGDDSHASYTAQPGAQHLRHHYATLGSYNVSLALIDGNGNYHHQQFAAAAYSSFTSASTLAANVTGNQHSGEVSTTIGLYGLFITLLSVSAIAWLHADQFAYADVKVPYARK